LEPGRRIESLQDPLHPAFDGPLSHSEPPGYRLIGQPGRGQRQQPLIVSAQRATWFGFRPQRRGLLPQQLEQPDQTV
jgi:hypothetical protein